MIVSDSREPLMLQGLADQVQKMDYGDYKIIVGEEPNVKQLIFERKTVNDFVSSLHSGRLNEQLLGCDCLIIQFQYGFDIERYLPNSSSEDFFDKVNGVENHHRVFMVGSNKHLFAMLKRIEAKLEKGEYGIMKQEVVKKPLPTPVRILGTFTGIATTKAIMLLKEYRTVRNVIVAADRLETIPNIGMETMGKITADLDEEFKE